MTFITFENTEKILQLMQEAADKLMVPKFGHLTKEAIQVKADKSLVTEVDHAVEAFLIEALTRLHPGSAVLGEEGFEADAARAQALLSTQPVWVVDPLDGTSNFAAGKKGWGILISYVERGIVQMIFALDPIAQQTLVVIRSQGVLLNGVKTTASVTAKPLSQLKGVAWFQVVDTDIVAAYKNNGRQFQELADGTLMSIEVAFAFLKGEVDFVVSDTTKPWDLLPAVLLLEEIGGRAGKLPAGSGFTGEALMTMKQPALLTRHAAQWQEIKTVLFAGISDERLAQGINCL